MRGEKTGIQFWGGTMAVHDLGPGRSDELMHKLAGNAGHAYLDLMASRAYAGIRHRHRWGRITGGVYRCDVMFMIILGRNTLLLMIGSRFGGGWLFARNPIQWKIPEKMLGKIWRQALIHATHLILIYNIFVVLFFLLFCLYSI